MASERLLKEIANNKAIMKEVKDFIYDCGHGEMEEINSYSNLHLVRCLDIDYGHNGIESFMEDLELYDLL